MAWDINAFISSPYTQLAAGLLQGAQPGGNFAQGLNLGLLNTLNMQRQQAATALIGQQIARIREDRQFQQDRMAALQRLGQVEPQNAPYYAAGIAPPKPSELEVAAQLAGYTPGTPEFQQFIRDVKLHPQAVTNVNVGGNSGFRSATPEEQAALSSGNVLIDTKTGKPMVAPSLPADQRLAAGYASRMMQAEQTLGQLPITGAESIAGRQDALAPDLQSSSFQQMRQAQRDWIMAVLRKESQGQITQTEEESYLRNYFPVAGDSENNVLQKKAARIEQTRSMLKNAGGAFQDQIQLPKVYHTKEAPENARPGDLWQDPQGDWYEFQ